ncbi:MAG TPA: hypothetical protein VHJ78_08895 [Actinomycetota bacterium]|nr:hypothetical protein [Actinomycetota bacterium]
MVEGEFRRRLPAGEVEFLRSDPVASRVLEAVHGDPSLDMQLRGTYVDVYYDSLSAFQLDFEGKRLRLGSPTDRRPRPDPWASPWASLADLRPEDIRSGIEWVKDQRAEKASALERYFESNVVRDNRSADSPVLVLDRQVAQPGWNLRLGLVLYDVAAERLVLAGLGLMTNVDRSGEAFEELLRYQALLAHTPGVAAAYPHVYEQKVQLGLLQHDLPRLRVDRSPLLLYVLGGFDQATAATWMRERIRIAVQRKRREFRTLQVHLQTVPGFREPGASRLKPVENLPLFEEWAATENLA